jgi:glycine/D-amino acid oxidase-like deaminating enzyme
VPKEVEIAIIGGGFTGLATAAWLGHLAPKKSVAVFEAGRIGAGASGRTGGMVLSETAAGDLPGLGDVLAGFSDTLEALEIQCDFYANGAWEIGRSGGLKASPVRWNDSGRLRVVSEIPGGTVDPGKLLSGLGDAAHRSGALLFEGHPVEKVEWGADVELAMGPARVRAGQVLFATNALGLEASGLEAFARPCFTLAVATEPLSPETLKSIGLEKLKLFYTADLPYLWGRVIRRSNASVWGAGLVHVESWRDLGEIDVHTGEAARLLDSLESRVRRLHPALQQVQITHRWGGAILFAPDWRPMFHRHPASDKGLVLGAYAGHGVALSVYLGRWAAEALLGRRELPHWPLAGRQSNGWIPNLRFSAHGQSK